jgi:PAS domain-containing protein
MKLGLTLRAKHRLRVFRNRMFWDIFGYEREDIKGGRRRMHNEEVNDLYF